MSAWRHDACQALCYRISPGDWLSLKLSLAIFNYCMASLKENCVLSQPDQVWARIQRDFAPVHQLSQQQTGELLPHWSLSLSLSLMRHLLCWYLHDTSIFCFLRTGTCIWFLVIVLVTRLILNLLFTVRCLGSWFLYKLLHTCLLALLKWLAVAAVAVGAQWMTVCISFFIMKAINLNNSNTTVVSVHSYNWYNYCQPQIR